VWYRVFVPYGTKAGIYKGNVTVKPSNAPEVAVPVEVRVRDFDLPKMPHLRMVVGISASDDFEFSYKINPSSIYHFKPEWLEQFGKWARQGATAINLDYCSGSEMEDKEHKLPSDSQLEKMCSNFEIRLKALESFGLRDKAYFYMFDEASADCYPAMRRSVMSSNLASPISKYDHRQRPDEWN